MHLGRGNTAGDVVVQVPDARVVATGDLVVAPTPYGIGSYPGDWIATLPKLEALGATTFVPGHGPVQRDTVYVEQLVGLIEAVRSQAAAAVRDGLSLEDGKKRADLSVWKKRFAGDDFYRGVSFDQFFADPFLDRAYQEAKGKMEDE